MGNDLFWTQSKARLQFAKTGGNGKYNWLFLPGGPGLGSESLKPLINILNLPGKMWLLDLPGDGSNITDNDSITFANWPNALIEAASAMENVILVTHSTGGMFALATPELEHILTGLVLMDSAPDAGWQAYFAEYISQHLLPETEALHKRYEAHPSNELLKQLTIASVPYFSTTKSVDDLIQLMNFLPFNCESHLWADKHFDKTYGAKWFPLTLPTLIFAGDEDHITPLKLFANTERFQRSNILIRSIQHAAHFPWMDNPQQVIQVFTEYSRLLQS
jgi:pimeloyl-ACP methyl ester carboxylesterase